jgi:hypothetical protein
MAEKSRCIHDCTFGITWSGIVYPCCTFYGYYGGLAICDARISPLGDLLQNPVTKLVQLLETLGFTALLAAAKQVDKKIIVDNFSEGCVVCQTLFNNILFVRKFMPLIADKKMREAVSEYIDYVEKRGILSADKWVQADIKRPTTNRRPKKFIIK